MAGWARKVGIVNWSTTHSQWAVRPAASGVWIPSLGALHISLTLYLSSPGPWPEFLSLTGSLNLLFGPWTSSIFKKDGTQSLTRLLSVTGAQGCLPLEDRELVLPPGWGGLRGVLPAVPDIGRPWPCLGSWLTSLCEVEKLGTPPPTGLRLEVPIPVTPLPSLGCFKEAWKDFYPTWKHQRNHIYNPTNQSYTLFTFLWCSFHFSSVKIYIFLCSCNLGAYIFNSALFLVYFSKVLPSTHIYYFCNCLIYHWLNYTES